MNKYVLWHNSHVNRQERNRLNNHKSGLVWITGLSAAGKSTIAHSVEKKLFEQDIRTYVLDGDNIRHGLNKNLDFSREGRKENLRRIVEVSKLMVDAGILVLAAFISPYSEDRQYVKSRFENDNFVEIYVKCSLEECEKRDPKGHYERARKGIITYYTGISAPYEEPENPDLILDTVKIPLKKCVDLVIDCLIERGIITSEKVV
jgi:adenylylsulfate kinase